LPGAQFIKSGQRYKLVKNDFEEIKNIKHIVFRWLKYIEIRVLCNQRTVQA